MNKILNLLTLGCSFTLISCNIFEGKSSSNSSSETESSSTSIEPYVYSKKDIKYFTKDNEEISISDSLPHFYKAFAGYSAVAIANIGGSYGPVLAGEDPIQVCYKTDTKGNFIGPAGSLTFEGKQYFYSKVDGFIKGSLDGRIKFDNYFSSFTTLEEVATDLISKATFVEIDPSLKNEFKYTLKNDLTYSISAGPYSNGKEAITIPSTYEGKKITSIDEEGFANLNYLKYLDFEENSNISSIGVNAFNGCVNIETLTIPDSVKTISYGAFKGCSSLKLIFLPSSVKTVGSYAFYGCGDELMIYCEAESTPSGYFVKYKYGGSDEADWYGSAKRIWYGMLGFADSENYTYGIKLDDTLSISRYKANEGNVIVPSDYQGRIVTSIGRYAFEGKNTMENLNLPETLNDISYSAFQGCSLLKEVSIPSGVKEIGSGAFKGCSSLKYAFIPSSVKTVGSYAFYGCSDELMIYCEAESRPSGYYVLFPYAGTPDKSDWRGSAKRIWWGMLGFASDDSFDYGKTLDGTLSVSRYIGNDSEVSIPSSCNGISVTSIGSLVFKDNHKIKSLILPSSVAKICEQSFNGCTLLSDVKLSSELQALENGAFLNCLNLRQIVIPSSVKLIGSSCFKNCNEDLIIYCEASSKSKDFYTGKNGDWNGNAKVYYADSWEYDRNGNPVLKQQ